MRLVKDVNKSGFVPPGTRTQVRKAIKSFERPADRKNLVGRLQTTCLSNSKLNEQPGEVELAATIFSRNSPERTRHGQT